MSVTGIASACATGAIGSNAVVDVPAGTASGDLMLALAISPNAISTPSGWTLVAANDGGTPHTYIAIFKRIAGGSEVATNFGQSNSFQVYRTVIVTTYRGQHGTPIIDVAPSFASFVTFGTTIRVPSITTLHADALVVRGAGFMYSSTIDDPGSSGGSGQGTSGGGTRTYGS